MRLLIVEDSNDLRAVMKTYLGMFGHEVSDVSSVDEALREMETPMTDAARFCPEDTVILTKPFVFGELATALDTVRYTQKTSAQSVGRQVKDADI